MAKVINVEVERCIIPEVRVTAAYDEELEKLLHDSLEATGQIVPIVVVEHDGGYYVVDGKHRLEEAKARGDSRIPAVVRPGDPVDVLLLNLVTNKLRGKTKASEMVAVIQTLYTVHKLGIEEIQERTGLSRDYIERLIKISQASAEVRKSLDEEVIGVGAAFEISRLPLDEQQAEVLNKYQIWRWPLKDLRDFINRVLEEMQSYQEAPQQEREPAPPPVYHCDVCKTEHDRHDLRPVLVCPDCFGVAWRGRQEVREGPHEQTG